MEIFISYYLQHSFLLRDRSLRVIYLHFRVNLREWKRKRVCLLRFWEINKMVPVLKLLSEFSVGCLLLIDKIILFQRHTFQIVYI